VVKVPVGIQPGHYELAVGVVDPENKTPAVRLIAALHRCGTDAG
jgi:hypothetical protein